ncbi:cytosine deaminase [cyanobiont of Ornithocercus magnificus]|nr:cytosine deaminase [cyanobiont of Ornithocercus magnificus]
MSVIDAWVPGGLIGSSVLASDRFYHRPKHSTHEGLVALRLHWCHGNLTSLELLPDDVVSPSDLILPRLLDAHVHLDKAFTWEKVQNLDGTYTGALSANLYEHTNRTASDVWKRVERALTQALYCGLRALRTHIDSVGPATELSWEVLQDLKHRWHPIVQLQLVALAPLDLWTSAEGERLAARVASCRGLLGGVLVPPCTKRDTSSALSRMLQLAEAHGIGVDLHIDESDRFPAAGLKILLQVLDQCQVTVPITCSHVSSIGMLRPAVLERLIDRMAYHHLQVVALPLTNGWLLGQSPLCTPVQRPLAPIRQLQQSGITVAVASDNVQDPWFPGGNFDPINLMAQSVPLAQLAPWRRTDLAPFTTAAARLMDLDWDGVLRPGAPADFLLLKDTNSWSRVLAGPPSRRVLVRGHWLSTTDDSPAEIDRDSIN